MQYVPVLARVAELGWLRAVSPAKPPLRWLRASQPLPTTALGSWFAATGPPRWMTIVGVVADLKQDSLAEPAFPAVFTPFAQTDEAWRRWMSVVSLACIIPARRAMRVDPMVALRHE